MIIGHIVEQKDNLITVIAPISQYVRIGQEVEVMISDSRRISVEQRKKTYALFRDISDFTGYVPDETKEIFKCDFVSKSGLDYFSLSNVDMTTARLFITYMIDWCLEWGVPCQDSLLNISEDISRYLYKCLEFRRCAICGGKADVHHIDAVGMGQNRNEKPSLGASCVALCRKHHVECHNKGNKDFLELYHCYGIKLDLNLCDKLNLKK